MLTPNQSLAIAFMGVVILMFTFGFMFMLYTNKTPKQILYTPPQPSPVVSPTIMQMLSEYRALLDDIKGAATVPAVYSLTDIVIDWFEGYRSIGKADEYYKRLMEAISARERELINEKNKRMSASKVAR